MSDLRTDVEVFCMLEELQHESIRLSDKDAEHLEWISGKERLMPADFAWIRLRHGELHKGVNDMARKPKKGQDEGGGTATLEPKPGEQPGEQGDLFECETKLAKKFKALAEELLSARRSKQNAKEKETKAIDAIRDLAHDSDIQADDDGYMRFKADDVVIEVTPRDEAVSVKPISRTPRGRSKGESPD